MRAAVAALVLVGCTDPEPAVVSFVEATPPVPRQSEGSFVPPCFTSDETCEPELFTGGLAIGDVDGDGRQDVVMTRLAAPDVLLLNRGDGFEDASEAWGLSTISAWSNGAALFDADRDGDLDLYVIGLGPPDAEAPNDRYYFWRNDGDRFVEDAEDRGLAFRDDTGHSGMSVAVGDYDRDGWPDLHLTEWRVDARGWPHERLLRNRGDGTFDDVTIEAGAFLGDDFCREEQSGCRPRSFASTFTDLDDDGWPDLAVASDFGTSRLLWNRGDGSFVDGTVDAGVGTDENGMGSAFGDVDGDGDLDWFVTSIADDETRCLDAVCGWGLSGNRLFVNEGGRRFVDATDDWGVREGGWGWGAAFFDVDLDGALDLTMTNGFDQPNVEGDEVFARDPMRLWLNEGDVMREAAAESGLAGDGPGRGLCVEDIDGDGDLDVLTVENGDGLRVWRNRNEGRHWIRIRATYADGTAAYGARVTVREQVREAGTGSHFLCSTEPVAHFGLGARSGRVAATVRWPTGSTTTHERLEVDALHVLSP